MHILIDSGSYHCLNVGDVAMLQAGIERMRRLWPHASIAAVTNAPVMLAAHCPGVRPVPLVGRVLFLGDRFFGRAERFLPGMLRERLAGVEGRFRRRWPSGLGALIAAKRALALRPDYAAARTYVSAVRRADLVVATGAGVFTDPFAENAVGVLGTLECAMERDTPTALMGQGIGPVADDTLRCRLAAVLRRVDLIALRERPESLRLLRSLGVSDDRIVVTGDDALEAAHRCTPAEPGDAIGVNLRVAGYAGVRGDAVEAIRPALQHAAALLGAPLAAVPIAHHPDCHDGEAIRSLLTRSDDDRSQAVPELNTPAKAIHAVSRCRVVVTGSYHAAVFALAQGIPAVGIAATAYYLTKFAGLADLFPGGCETVVLDGRDAGADLQRAIVAAWTSAPGRRASLLQAAREQIDAGHDAYRRLGELAGAPRHDARRNPIRLEPDAVEITSVRP